MMNTPTPTVSTADFMFFSNGHLFGEASSIRDAGAARLLVKSVHTDQVVEFQLTHTQRDAEGEILGWEYQPVDPTQCPKTKQIDIFND